MTDDNDFAGVHANMEKLLGDIVRSLVAEPDEVMIEKAETSKTIIYTIDVLNLDRGKIIGKGGAIINSLKVLFHALGCKHGYKVELELLD